jgi:hypothetical protein
VRADPPYSASDSARYGTIMVNRNKVVATLAAGLRTGGCVAWLDQVYPMFSKVMLQRDTVIGAVVSTNHRFRVLTASAARDSEPPDHASARRI